MKKLLLGIIFLSIILLPTNIVQAKSYNFGGYYCDAKKDLGDGTFSLTCHILATTDFNVNHIEGTLILKNVKLQEIRTHNDWVSNNGLSSNVSFTSSKSYNGSFSVADLIFTGNNSDTECEASFMPTLAEEKNDNHVCAVVDNIYYGKDGSIVSESKYYEDCYNYVCTVIDNKYYFDNTGKSVDYNEFMQKCSTTESPNTGINYGFIILPIGLLSLIGITKFVKKNTKIYKI